ncbi:MAG: hypothetical protein E2O29_01870 [Deltaproteobacteria bacterium]|nr:MAG: hypothetical protein E2O29_01870 [Deltaproteobacteria bacterium]
MALYRKKPVVIEAVQFKGTKESFDECRKFAGESFFYDYQESPRTFIKTIEGIMGCPPTWWIIKGIQGEFYPCKNEIFEKTYDKVDVEDAQYRELKDNE